MRIQIDQRPVPLERGAAEQFLADALTAADVVSNPLELKRLAGLIAERLRREGVGLYKGTLVRLPAPAGPRRPSYLAEIGSTDRVSTLADRLRAFGAYAAARAYGDEADAFEAAVIETMRLNSRWGRKIATMHTARFIVPAFERAFPKVDKAEEDV